MGTPEKQIDMKKLNLKVVLIAALFMTSVTVSYSQQPYRQEIIENIIDPCYRMSVRSKPELMKHMTEDEALVAIKLMADANIEQTVNALSPIIPELDLLIGRERVYEMGLGACIKGVMQDSETQSAAPVQPDLARAAITRPTPDMKKEYGAVVESSSPYIERAGLTSYKFEGNRKIEIFLMVSNNVNGQMARELGLRALAILENNWPQLEPADYTIDVMWNGNYTSSHAIDAATIAKGNRDQHDADVIWDY